MKQLITHVRLVDSSTDSPGALLVENGHITKIYYNQTNPHLEGVPTLDGGGHVLMPGFIDTHCHLRDPGLTYKEDMKSGMKAALKGGFTTLVAMANTAPVMDNADKLKTNLDKAKALDLCTLVQNSALTENFSKDRLVDFESTRQYTQAYSNDGLNIDDADTMAKGLVASKTYDFILATHCEPETATVQRDIELLREKGGHLHVCHISKKATLDAIVKAKKEGLDITCEVTPHHLYASGVDYKVHPPFRSEEDRLALIQGCADGTIDCCGTDHAPHSQEDKAKGSPGINNFETAFAMYHKVFSDHSIPLTRLSEMMSAAPAKRYTLQGGLLTEGSIADLVLVDPQAELIVEPDTFISKSNNTPFAGERLQGRVLWTMKGGTIRYDYGQTL